MVGLAQKRCVPCEGGTVPLFRPKAEELLKELSGWELASDAKSISKKYLFKNFSQAIAFANKVAVVADEENHHPDLHIYWGKAIVQLSTHAIGGLSENDFILAAKIDAQVI